MRLDDHFGNGSILQRNEPRRDGCLVAGPNHRHPDVFHAEVGHPVPRER
jgi:hypothetical protein